MRWGCSRKIEEWTFQNRSDNIVQYICGTRISKPCPLFKSDFFAAELAEMVWLNCVCTFGVASAGYWWGRAGGAIIRLSHYLIDWVGSFWVLLYSDNSWTTGSGERYERGLVFHLLILSVLGVPLNANGSATFCTSAVSSWGFRPAGQLEP